MKIFNIVRYILSVIVPIAVCFAYGWVWFVVVSFMLLYANNVIDDVVFYYGSCFSKGRRSGAAISSPVEGIVTKIKRNSKLYEHLYKEDILTKEQLVETSIECIDKEYLHVAIFLNKFNKHAVANMFGTQSSIKQYTKDGELVEMVECDKLVSDNKGDYLNNTFVDIAYENGTHVVLTMDKYVSKAILAHNNIDAELLICKGSQCDMYIPNDVIIGDVKVGVNDPIRLLEDVVDCKWIETVSFDPYCFRKTILECISNSGFNMNRAFADNCIKTLSTIMYNMNYLSVQLIVGVLFPTLFVSLFSIYIYAFVFVRFYKNILYNLMNFVGYKEWMTTTYNKLNRVLNYGKQ